MKKREAASNLIAVQRYLSGKSLVSCCQRPAAIAMSDAPRGAMRAAACALHMLALRTITGCGGVVKEGRQRMRAEEARGGEDGESHGRRAGAPPSGAIFTLAFRCSSSVSTSGATASAASAPGASSCEAAAREPLCAAADPPFLSSSGCCMNATSAETPGASAPPCPTELPPSAAAAASAAPPWRIEVAVA